MNIVLLGYGKMGKLIERFALQRGHQIHLIVDENNREASGATDLQGADMASDVSRPGADLANIDLCFEADIPIVVGTTGWYDGLPDIRTKCMAGNKALLYGSNFSIGVNVFFHINRLLAAVMKPYKQYDV